MKKRLVTVVSLILIIVMLAGCAADSTAAAFTVQETVPVREPICFENVKYVRPDIDSMYKTVDVLHGALKNPLGFEKILACIELFELQLTNFETMYAVANIRTSLDVSDDYYDEEYTWCMENSAEVQMLVDELYFACADSVHTAWLNQLPFWRKLSADYQDVVVSESGGTYEELFEINARETQLLAEYRDIMSELTIEVDGQERSFDEYVLEDYDKANAAFLEKYNPVLGQLYIELMALRKECAAVLGYDSYAELAYDGFFRDYSPKESEEYIANVKKYMTELYKQLEQSGLREKLIYDPMDERELELYLETVVEGFGGSIEEIYDFMKEYHMYDFGMSEKKSDISFQTYLVDYNAPYLFLRPYGYTDDLVTVLHEFGHYADGYIRKNAYASMDLSEVFSQTMQLLGIEQLRCVMTDEEYQSFMYMNLIHMLDSMQEQTMLAEFELRAYELEDPTVDKLNELCRQLDKEYGLNEETEEFSGYSWINIPHLFDSPFYVMSYSVSAAVALEIYETELETPGSGIENFIMMSESMLPGLMETVDYAGLSNPLYESRVRHTADFIRSQLSF